MAVWSRISLGRRFSAGTEPMENLGEVLSVTSCYRVPLSAVRQFPTSIGSGGVKETVSRYRPSHISGNKGFPDEACQGDLGQVFPALPDDRASRVQGERADEDGQRPKRKPFSVRQKFVAPIEGSRERLVPRQRCPAPVLQYLETVIQHVRRALNTEGIHSACSKLDR
jgi:hypothetical protein